MLSLLLASAEVRGTVREGTVYSLLCLATVGALILAGAGDMMFLVLGLLLTSLATFALVAYPDDDPATEAAMKYFVFGSVAGAVMIFGLTYWFGAAGSTMIADLEGTEAIPLWLSYSVWWRLLSVLAIKHLWFHFILGAGCL